MPKCDLRSLGLPEHGEPATVAVRLVMRAAKFVRLTEGGHGFSYPGGAISTPGVEKESRECHVRPRECHVPPRSRAASHCLSAKHCGCSFV
jgi:hypothetical protein